MDDGVVSATVIAPRLRNADGPTLSIMALGVERGLTFAKQLGVDAIILDSHRVVHMTPGAARRFALLDSTYSIPAPLRLDTFHCLSCQAAVFSRMAMENPPRAAEDQEEHFFAAL